MRLAVLPFNALEGTKPGLGRQFAAFAAEQARVLSNAEVNTVQMLTQIQDQDGSQRIAFVNVADSLLEVAQVRELFEQQEIDIITDGSLLRTDDNFELVLRIHRRTPEEPEVITRNFTVAEVLPNLDWLLRKIIELAGGTVPAEIEGKEMEFGTASPAVFLQFLEGFDSLSYINQANGAVAREFSPNEAIESLLAAVEADPDFEGPYQVLVQLVRACVGYRIGAFEVLEGALTKLTTLVSDDFAAYFALGELHEAVGQFSVAADYYEKAAGLQPDDAGLWTRLGIAQMRNGMPVNAERNFRKAIGMEGDEKPTTGFLADVLAQTGRAHEVPELWKTIIDVQADNAMAHARYGVSLVNAGKETEGEAAFEHAIESLDDNTVIKRFYAPYLVNKGDLDRAMDFYEDCLDVAANDVELLQEYASTLQKADRTFEVPGVLRNILAANPHPNVRAETQAWLVEIDQPKRAESVANAQKKMENGDFDGAIRDLKPLRNWLADYWKMWILLGTAHNRIGQHRDAEDAIRRLIDIFPGFEPAYGELVTALVGQHKAEEAYQIMRYVLSQNPQSAGLAINMAIAAKAAGHEDEARALARQLREAVGPANTDLNTLLDELES